MRTEIFKLMALVVFASTCSDPPTPAPVEVRHFGELRAIMHEGRTGPAVQLRDVVPGPHAYGIGALGELRGEVTVLDDVVWLAYPRADGTADVRPDAGVDEAAALFVVAQVERWRGVPLTEDIEADGLDAAIARLAAAAGVDTTRPFPVRITGTLVDLRWHVVDGSKLAPGSSHADHARTAVRGAAPEIDGELVGFYSTQHQGVFTHRGASTHFHVVAAAANITGHVDGVGVRRGATVYLPQ
jgi:alpha-acetolactate decarboxylase